MAVSKYDIKLDLAKNPGTSHAFLIEMIGANKRVLDVGCDTGYLGEELAAFGNTMYGFEYNEASAEVARTHYQRVEIGDLETVDLATAFGELTFDLVVFGDVLEHLRDPLPVLRRARAIVAPGGCVLISVPNIAHGDVRLALLKGQFRYTKVGILDDTHTRFFTRDSLVEFIHDAGFTVIELRRTKNELFKTEIGVREEDFEPALVAQLRADPEASTYQFVVRAVPDDAVQVTSEQALLVDTLTGQLAEQRRLVRELTARESALSARITELVAASAGARAGRGGRVRPLAGKLKRRLRRQLGAN